MTSRKQGLDIGEYMDFQRREWRVQTVGRWLLLLFLIAAVMGVFGSGPLSAARASSTGSPLSADYQRFVRVGVPTRIALELGPAAPLTTASGSATVQLHLNRAYFDRIQLNQVFPPPLAIEVRADDVVFSFTAPDDRSAVLTVLMELQPRRGGRQIARFRLGDRQALQFNQLAYF